MKPAYRLRNVSLFRNHLSASKYGYKRTYPSLRSLFLFTHHLLSPFPLSFPPYQGRSFSQPPSSRCVFSFHFKVGRFVLVLKVGRSLSTLRCVISIQIPRWVFPLYFLSQGRSFLFYFKVGPFVLFSKVGLFSSISR